MDRYDERVREIVAEGIPKATAEQIAAFESDGPDVIEDRDDDEADE